MGGAAEERGLAAAEEEGLVGRAAEDSLAGADKGLIAIPIDESKALVVTGMLNSCCNDIPVEFWWETKASGSKSPRIVSMARPRGRESDVGWCPTFDVAAGIYIK